MTPLVSSGMSAANPSSSITKPKRRRLRITRAIIALMLREMSTTYGRSPGGYVWVILEQLGILMILSVAFSLLLRQPSLGDSFILFYATGYLPFKMFQDISTKTASCIRFSKPLLAYPTITFMDALLARFILAVLTQIMVSYIILIGILALADTRVILDFNPMVVSMSMAALLGVSVGALNSVLFEFFPIWKTAYKVATRPLLLASGVIFLLEDLPQSAQAILWYNPLIHVTAVMRQGFYPFYSPDYVSYVFVCGLSLTALLFGLLLLRRNYRTLVQQ